MNGYAYSYTGLTDDPEREKLAQTARAIATKAIKSGELVRGECEFNKPWRPCEGVIQAHHDDYAKPLEIRWLCHFHHQNLHAEVRRDKARAHFAGDSLLSAVERLVSQAYTDDEILDQFVFALDRAHRALSAPRRLVA